MLRRPTIHSSAPRAQILGLSIGASERDIKRAYRTLSLTHHPDKPGGNAELFQKIAKAHEALTDPVARANFEEFGNPDGRQAMEVSIGLPAWLVEGFAQWGFLSLYVGGLCVALPALMFYCWRSGRDRGPNGLNPGTFEWLKYRVQPDTSVKTLPSILAGCWEFGRQQPLNPEADSPALQRLLSEMSEEGRMAKPVRPEKSVIPPELILRNDVVIHAHLNRKPVGTPTLAAVQANILAKAEPALALMLEIAVARTLAPPAQRIPPHLEAAFAIIEFGQMVRNGGGGARAGCDDYGRSGE